MHFKDDPISDMHAKKMFIYFMSDASAWALKIWSRLLVPTFPVRSRRIQLPIFPSVPVYRKHMLHKVNTEDGNFDSFQR